MITFPISNTPRWIILTIDIIIVVFSIVLAYLLRFNFHIPEVELKSFPLVLAFVVFIRLVSFLIAKTYAGIVRYTSTEDVFRIFLVISSGSLVFVFTNIIKYHFIDSTYLIPFSIIIIDFFTTTLLMIIFRMIVKVTYLEFLNPSKAQTNVIIFGAGEAGIITKNALDRDAKIKYKILAFIDDNPQKIGKTVEGVTIYGRDKLKELLETNTIAHVIMSTQNINAERKQEIIEICLAYNTKVFNVPPVSKWINGELSFNQIKKINIEDLLERDIIRLDKEKIGKQLIGKTVLITGASGSIGSELVRQIGYYATNKLILTDQAESPLFHLELECMDKFRNKELDIIIADICNKSRIEHIFQQYKPDIVFHAAAYKHVPMMEQNVAEAVKTNIDGTNILADLSVKYKVQKFIMVSTDKAVNPTSVMGASKRIAEIYTQALNQKNSTKFITTRFGNVLGSNGSVIPIFREQIEKGGPVTVTHPDITRYFMTIPEACQLVLEASAMGKGGEIYIFDMGKSVKIVDLAKKMIKLSGLTLGKDIQIKFTGLRPGEKLFEELLNDQENTMPTHHSQIMIAKVKEYDLYEISKEIDVLIKLIDQQDDTRIVKKMKEIVPEFKSQNSIYEKLDAQD
jgi:FlaA1/EpsC-like NDP-sugar epimerase